MRVLEDWRERHPLHRGSGPRLIALILMLIMVVIFILNSDRIAAGFTMLFPIVQGTAGTTE